MKHKSIGGRGMTLIELLIVISIIGVLATAGNVSFEELKRLGRDVKRLGDMKQMQTALELFFASHSFYPADGVPGSGGVVLGPEGVNALDDTGWTRGGLGVVYIRMGTGNPLPNGRPYLYRSMDAQGNDCERNCAFYEIEFATEGRLGDLLPGEHSVTVLGIVRPEGVKSLAGPGFGLYATEGAAAFGRETISALRNLERQTTAVLDNPEVERAGNLAAPVSLALPLAGAAASAGAFLPRYFLAFFSQPFALLFRRRKKSWGIVYNSLTKLQVDLAIVRLIELSENKVVASTVTDKAGRFSFSAPPGRYKIFCQKSGMAFPSIILSGTSADGRYADLYFGEPLELGPKELPHPNIPMDPREEELTREMAIRRNFLKNFQSVFSFSGPVLAFASLAADPGALNGSIFFLHILLFVFFKRIAGLRRQKDFGIIYDEESKTPVARAVVRLYTPAYHKLVETKISDARGRYGFLIGPGEFYITVERAGYGKTETEPFKAEDPSGTTIKSSLPLRRIK